MIEEEYFPEEFYGFDYDEYDAANKAVAESFGEDLDFYYYDGPEGDDCEIFE